MNQATSEMYARIDAGRYDSITVISDSMSGLLIVRERIAHLPTWPWPPQLLRGFVSALLLPLDRVSPDPLRLYPAWALMAIRADEG